MDMFERGGRFAPAALLLCALLLGGGTSKPLFLMLIELLAIATLLWLTWAKAPFAPLSGERLVAYILLALIGATALLQFVPLPFSIWSALPGRETALLIREAAGLAPSPHPLSLNPDVALRRTFALLPPVAMFLAVLRASITERRTYVAIVVAVACVSVLLGLAQLAAGPGVHNLYLTAHDAYPIGLFENRNHQAALCIVAIILLPALLPHDRGSSSGSAAAAIGLTGVALLCAVGALTTTSRMGNLLLLPALFIFVVTLPYKSAVAPHLRIGFVLGILALVSLGVASNQVVRTSAERLLVLADARSDFFDTSLSALRANWPIGSGLGSFVQVYASYEPLEQVTPRFVNHAHNDFVEVVLELGAWGLTLMTLGLAFLVSRAFRPPHPSARALHRAAAFAVLSLLVHSTVDYPLRTLGLLSLFGMLIGMLLDPPRPQRL